MANYEVTRVTAEGQITTGQGVVGSISIAPLTATPTAGLLTLYDSTSEANKVIYSEWVFATTPGHTIELEAVFRSGLFVGFDGTLANVSVTVCFTR